MRQQTKDFKFYMKVVDEAGTFDGLAAVYGNVDLGGDVIEPGAFTRTIKNGGGKVPLLWQHDQTEPIGVGTLQDSAKGLMIHGKLVMESDVARKALGLMKADVLTGLSIGYDTVVSEYDKQKDVRKLKELKLYEVSLVTFPMNPRAQVTAVKANIDELSTFVRTQMEQVRNGGRLSADMRDDLKRAADQILALVDADPGNDSAIPPAEQHLSDSDLRSLINHIQEIQ